jgi:hypothetical protein
LPSFSYADGTEFDSNSGYKLGATKLRGECLYLKQNTYVVMDSKCSKSKGFICQWNSKQQKFLKAQYKFQNMYSVIKVIITIK